MTLYYLLQFVPLAVLTMVCLVLWRRRPELRGRWAAILSVGFSVTSFWLLYQIHLQQGGHV